MASAASTRETRVVIRLLKDFDFDQISSLPGECIVPSYGTNLFAGVSEIVISPLDEGLLGEYVYLGMNANRSSNYLLSKRHKHVAQVPLAGTAGEKFLTSWLQFYLVENINAASQAQTLREGPIQSLPQLFEKEINLVKGAEGAVPQNPPASAGSPRGGRMPAAPDPPPSATTRSKAKGQLYSARMPFRNPSF